jgi:tetratricopeptide (TPR) repeat protein/tRNA A-37 threonylcarbamoyl transferase component Bud32
MQDSWERVKEIAADAIELPEAERDGFLYARCADDLAMLEEVRELLRADAAAGDFMAASATLLPESVRALAPGTQLGPYVVVALIGEGGSSEVYRARQDAPIAREVAIKLLKPGMDSRGLLARFAAERQTLARLDHPHIARVLDAGAIPSGRPWIAVELVLGQPITSFAEREALDRAARLELFAQVCDAVAHAHRRGVIHRDLKPANLLVARVDGTAIPKVIDFGIAKLLQPSDEHGTLTTTGILLGTPAYASPEQLDEKGDVDTRTDVWALGVILYELLTGTRPSDGSEGEEPAIAELVRRVRSDAIEAPSKRARRRSQTPPPPELDWICLRALERDRERRYATVDALAADVLRFLAREPLSVGPPTLRYRLRLAAKRHRALVGAALIAVVALIGGSVASVFGLLSARSARDAATLAADSERLQRGLAEALAQRESAARTQAEVAMQEARAVSDFLSQLFLAARPAQRGKEVRVVDLLAASDQRFAAVARFPAAEANLRRVVAETYIALGELSAAEPHIDAALRLAHEHYPANDWRLAQHLMVLADLRSRQGRIAELVPVIDQLDQVARAARGPDHAYTRFVLDLRAKCAFEQGRPADAAAALRGLVALDEAAGRRREVAQTLGNLSQVLLSLREESEARACAERALALAEELYGLEHAFSISTARKAAAIHLSRGDHAALVAALEPLVERAHRVFGPSHFETLGIENYLALGFHRLGRLEEAEALFKRVIAENAKTLSREHPQAAMAIQNFAALLEERGDLAGAEQLTQDALERFRKLRGEDHADVWRALQAHCRVVTKRGRASEVADSYAAAVEGLRRTLGETSPHYLSARAEWLAEQSKGR